MKLSLFPFIFLFCALMGNAEAARQSKPFQFGIVGHAADAEDSGTILSSAIDEANLTSAAFLVVNGIKSDGESCSDRLYDGRMQILSRAEKAVIVSLAASDWTECKNSQGKPAAIERINRLRELFFSDGFSLGGKKIALMRQSSGAKFRSYAENSRWEIGPVLFATLNLPANNNHYRPEAGRNNEFDDRQIANRDWLQRIFTSAKRKKFNGIVIFTDGNPLVAKLAQAGPGSAQERDGFAEARRNIAMLASKFPGNVLLIYQQLRDDPDNGGIRWHHNVAQLGADIDFQLITVDPSASRLFVLGDKPEDTQASSGTVRR